MKKLTLLLPIALLAGSNICFAADETPGEKSSGMEKSEIVTPGRIEDLPKAEKLSAKEATQLKTIGTKVFGIKWGKKLTAISDHGFQAVTDGTTTVSYRPAGNAYFVQTGKMSGKSAFKGSDKQLIERGRTLLSSLGIHKNEIADAKILQQYVTEGVMDPATQKVEVSTPRKDRRSLVVTRAIDGLPVFNSRLALDLDGKGNIAALELSWPKITGKVLEEGMRLKKIAGAEFKGPELKGAQIESAQAGILHSPAASFLDEQVAVIRVIYAPTDSKVGKKPVVYLGVDGRPVAIPRQTEARLERPIPIRVAPDVKKPQ